MKTKRADRPPTGPILYLDTTGDPARMLFSRDGTIAIDLSLPAGNLAETLPAKLDGFLAECGTSPAEIAALVIPLGPAGYTGTRIGISTAWGFRLTFGTPVWGIPSLDLAAALHASDAEACLVALDAGRGELFLIGCLPGDNEHRWLEPRTLSREDAEALVMPDGTVPLHRGPGWQAGPALTIENGKLWEVLGRWVTEHRPLEDGELHPIHLERAKPEFRPPAGWHPPAAEENDS